MDCDPQCHRVCLEKNSTAVGGVGTHPHRGAEDVEPEAEAAGGFGMLICKPSKRRGSERSRAMVWMRGAEERVTDLGA